MGLVEYSLVSDPERSIAVPEEYAARANELVTAALEHGRDGVESMKGDPLLTNRGILQRLCSLANHPTSALQDEVYLRVCVSLNEQEGLSRSPAAMELDVQLVETLDSLVRSP